MSDQAIALIVIAACAVGAHLLTPHRRGSLDHFMGWGVTLAVVGGVIYVFATGGAQ
jgi:hypothetical protein